MKTMVHFNISSVHTPDVADVAYDQRTQEFNISDDTDALALGTSILEEIRILHRLTSIEEIAFVMRFEYRDKSNG